MENFNENEYKLEHRDMQRAPDKVTKPGKDTQNKVGSSGSVYCVGSGFLFILIKTLINKIKE